MVGVRLIAHAGFALDELVLLGSAAAAYFTYRLARGPRSKDERK
jgi:hypothetical protein